MSRYNQREMMQMRRQRMRNELADELRRKRFGPKPGKSLKEQVAEYVKSLRKGESFDDEDAWRYTGTGTDMINEVAEVLWQHSKKDKSIRVEGNGYVKVAQDNVARGLRASDRKSLIRLASSLPAGSEDRRAILSALKQTQTR